MKIGVIGAQGNLGTSLTNLLLKNGFGNRLFLSDLKSHHNNSSVINKANVLFLCVKPNEVKNVLRELNDNDKVELIISCASAVALEELKLGNKPVFRCMMNLPIAYGEGTVTYIGNLQIRLCHIQMLNKLLRGPKLMLVEEEKLIDVSTILTGSMPAFSAFIANEVIKFGMKNGFTYEESKDLYTETVKGTMTMLQEKSAMDIMKEVSSPNGVTIKTLEFLTQHKLGDILTYSLENSLKQVKSLKD